ncbi:uncharacterized protein LOC131019093 [Salvia miltiorrhiza]|uniref:uncharacterized protein LOC131019093 n=1 Tax=Salvia miltiorrhiza TaxID=226208 RepID=UPI0025AB9621|nr:uncharacterized protein LOC131019093 [Salvia miltiorrhiza]
MQGYLVAGNGKIRNLGRRPRCPRRRLEQHLGKKGYLVAGNGKIRNLGRRPRCPRRRLEQHLEKKISTLLLISLSGAFRGGDNRLRSISKTFSSLWACESSCISGAIIRLHDLFLSKPEAVPADCSDPRWRWFKGCLGALDGTYVSVTVGNEDKPRYRTRKGQISTNVLGVCDRHCNFSYVLAGWEGSAADSRVLRDAIRRPHGLKVPRGKYYLCDNGYANSEGFLTPFKGVRYHLKEWGPNNARPQNKEELFNLRHSKARNAIERAFGILKMRWGILRSPSFYPIRVQNRIIMACFLINNFIRKEMPIDPIEEQLDAMPPQNGAMLEEAPDEFVEQVESSPQWQEARNALAESMWLQYINNN